MDITLQDMYMFYVVSSFDLQLQPVLRMAGMSPRVCCLNYKLR